MTSNISIPKDSKVETKMASVLKGLSGKRITKRVKFMGEDVEIAKLTVAQTEEIQNLAKSNKAAEDDTDSGMELIKTVVRLSVKDAEDLTDDDFAGFALEELTKLTTDIMKFSGMQTQETGK